MRHVDQPIFRPKSASPKNSVGEQAQLPKRDGHSASSIYSHVAESLLHREHVTAQAVHAIDAKIVRLIQARDARTQALKHIRSALAEAIVAGHAAPDRHENIP